MKIKFWGTRGSIPVSGPEYNRYGGDTTCVEIRNKENEIIIIDAGSGIRRLGKSLLEEGRKSYTVLFTHSHWDHVMGFPFFMPVYRNDTEIHMMGCPFAQNAVKDMISKTMQPPTFPVRFEEVASKFYFSEICTDGFNIGSMRIIPTLLSHPNHGLGYKFIEDGVSFVFITDNELGYTHNGGLTPRDYEEFGRNADLFVHDSEWRIDEYVKRRTWGHSTFKQAAELALRAGAKRFGMFHHNQERTDSQIDEMVSDCRGIIKREHSDMECFAVAAGQEIELKKSESLKSALK